MKYGVGFQKYGHPTKQTNKRKARKGTLALLLILTMVVGIYGFSTLAVHSKVGQIASTEEWTVLKLVNRERMAKGLQPLAMNGKLQKASDVRATEIITHFDHKRPSGSSCYTALDEQQLSYQASGENIAAGYGHADAVMQGWMESQGHRENILNAKYTHMGAGYTTSSQNGYRTYWTQFFTGSDKCAYSGLSLLNTETLKLGQGQTIEALDLALECTCANCGSSYVPVIGAMCTGLDTTKTGEQTVTIAYRGMTVTAQVTVGGQGTGSTPPAPTPDPAQSTPPTPTSAPTAAPTATPEPTEEPTPADVVYNETLNFEDHSTGEQRTVNVIVSYGKGGTAYGSCCVDENQKVKIVGKPDEGFVFSGWYEGGELVSTEASYTFEATRHIGLRAAFRDAFEMPYRDVDKDEWYYSAVRYANEQGLMVGTEADAFEPDGSLSRAMITTVLYRLGGEPQTAFTRHYPDVAEGAWYDDAATWAYEKGISLDLQGSFDGEKTVTREEFAYLLYRHALSIDVRESLDPQLRESCHIYNDYEAISADKEEAMAWAVSRGLLQGAEDKKLEPTKDLTRAECAMLIQRYAAYRAQ